MMQAREWERLVGGFWRRVASLIRYGSLTALNSATPLQQAQATTLGSATLDGVEYFEPYGFTSAPHPGAEMVIVQPSGQRGNEVVLCIADRRYRMTTLQPGEVALFDDLGNTVHLTRAGIVILAQQQVQVTAPQVTVAASTSATITTAQAAITATTSATVTAPTIALDGNVSVSGTLVVAGVLTPAGGMAGVSGAAVTVTGGLTTPNDVVANGVSLKSHTHPSVQAGSGNTGVPNP